MKQTQLCEAIKILLFIHGDKGGNGKSTLSALATDFAVEQFGKVAVVEGDAKINDVARRFAGVPGVAGYLVDLARQDASEDAAVRLFEELEKSGAAHVIINTPASASSTLDAQADLILPAARDLGYRIVVGWMIGADEDSARLAGESRLCQEADRRVAVINERFGTLDKLIWNRHPAREAWLASGGLEATLPELTARVADVVRQHPGRISALTRTESGLPVITRTVIKRWVNAAWTGPCAAMFGNSTTEEEKAYGQK